MVPTGMPELSRVERRVPARPARGYVRRMPSTGVRRERRLEQQRWATLAGIAVVALVASADVAVADTSVIMAFVLAGPLIAAIGATVRQTMTVAVLAILVALALGGVDGIFLEREHLLRVAVVTLASVFAVFLAQSRVAWEREIDAVGRDASLARLQQVSAALSRAVSVEAVADSVAREGAAAAGAVAGFVALVDETDEELVATSAFGYTERELEPYRRRRLEPGRPATVALASGEPVFVESPARRRELFGGQPASHPAFAIVPLFLRDERRGVLVFGFPRAREFTVEERAYIEAIGRLSSQALDRAVLYQSEQRSRVALRVLLEASERLGALDDPDRMIESVARLAASRLGRWAVVDLVDPRTRECRRAAVTHADESRSPELERVLGSCADDAAVLKVLETGEPLVVGPGWARDEVGGPGDGSPMSRFAWRSTVLAPMSAGGRTIGVLSVGSDREEQPEPSDVELVEDVARRMASAVQRATVAREAREAEEQWYRQRLAAEHQVVELLQRSILPDVLPEVDGVEVAAAYRPVEPDVEIGGDWYDLVPVSEGRLLVVVGDVAGHGLPAAALMGRVRNATRAYAIEDPDPASVLERLDRLVTLLEPGDMVTAVAALHDPRSDEVRIARAGHLPPILVAPAGGRVVDVPGGPPLGVEAADLPVAAVPLPAGAALLLYTDGLVERRGTPIDEAVQQLAERVGSLDTGDLGALCSRLAGEVPEIGGRRDDVCVVAVRRRPR